VLYIKRAATPRPARCVLNILWVDIHRPAPCALYILLAATSADSKMTKDSYESTESFKQLNQMKRLKQLLGRRDAKV
jgi:hypothetical protein